MSERKDIIIRGPAPERESAPSHSEDEAPKEIESALEIGRILDKPPVIVTDILRDNVRLTRKWGHGAIHDSLPGLSSHVIMTYYGDREHDIMWRNPEERLASRTKNSTVTIIPAGYDGRWDIAGSIEVSHVYLPDSRLQAIAGMMTDGKHVQLLGRVAFDDPSAGRIMELLAHEAEAGAPSSRLFIEQALDLLCTQLVRGHSSFGALTVTAPRRGLADWQVKKVQNYMYENLEEDVGLDELAALVNLTRFHFCTAFRMATGRTPHEFLVRLRIRRAKELLSDPILPITEIALIVGYQTPSSFAAAFRKVTGITPSEFRKHL